MFCICTGDRAAFLRTAGRNGWVIELEPGAVWRDVGDKKTNAKVRVRKHRITVSSALVYTTLSCKP